MDAASPPFQIASENVGTMRYHEQAVLAVITDRHSLSSYKSLGDKLLIQGTLDISN